ncbi:hypothetical protein SLEP1_g41377 [Rubroshorea leprosula]|uniref:Uncharacterized protein n=1 Tax=Rubroshorea leprosula TaxID=152421 RepID=A0AAV5L7A8_9ROSI|nr:hypothetical protein SLEP1_g41377 [Rubroshorea leprosula]
MTGIQWSKGAACILHTRRSSIRLVVRYGIRDLGAEWAPSIFMFPCPCPYKKLSPRALQGR